jgi:hypothetical protein
MATQQLAKPAKIKSSIFDIFFGLTTDLLIDGALIALGVVLYYQFFIDEIFPVTISPALTDLVGGLTNAAYIMSGLPFIVGVFSLARAIAGAARKLSNR